MLCSRRHVFGFSIALALGGAVASALAQPQERDAAGFLIGELLPTGQRITPTAPPQMLRSLPS